MLKISRTDCFGLSLTTSLQFTLKMCAAAKNCKKITKNPNFGVHDRSKSSILIILKIPSSVLVMITACLYLSATVRTLDKPIAIK